MAEELKEKLNQQLAEKKNLVTNTEEDLKVEREWRTSLQDSIVKDRILIEELKQELSGFKSLTGVNFIFFCHSLSLTLSLSLIVSLSLFASAIID